MIRFFRHTRKKLMEKNKIRTYIFYAIGEILLIVIGILIALQVNNWNEERFNREKEKELLTELLNDLEEDQRHLKFQLALADSLIEGLEYLITRPEDAANVNSMIEKADGGVLANYRYSAMKSIEASGINIIRNKELIKSINAYYAWWDFGNEIYRIDFDPFHENIWMPFFRDHMTRINSNEAFTRKWVPNNYKKLIQNPEFRDLLIEKKTIFIDFRFRFLRTQNRLRQLSEDVETYLSEF